MDVLWCCLHTARADPKKTQWLLAETDKMEFENYFPIIVVLILAVVATGVWMYSKLFWVLAIMIGGPLRIYVVRKVIAEQDVTNEHGVKTHTRYIHLVTIEHEEGADEITVSRSVFETIMEGKTYVVKGKVWADRELTLVGEWKPLIP